MSKREEIWQAFLGRPLTTEEIDDQLRLRDRLNLYDDDPFWGIIVFFYFHIKEFHHSHEVLQNQIKDTLLQLHEKEFHRLFHLIEDYIQKQAQASTDINHTQHQSPKINKKFIHLVLGVSLFTCLVSCLNFYTIHQRESLHQNALQQWGLKNPEANQALFRCGFSSRSHVIELKGHHVCYPAGEGIGYYLD